MRDPERAVFDEFARGVSDGTEAEGIQAWVETWVESAGQMLTARRARATEDAIAVLDRWGPAIDQLELLVALAIGMGESVVQATHDQLNEEVTVSPQGQRCVIVELLW